MGSMALPIPIPSADGPPSPSIRRDTNDWQAHNRNRYKQWASIITRDPSSPSPSAGTNGPPYQPWVDYEAILWQTALIAHSLEQQQQHAAPTLWLGNIPLSPTYARGATGTAYSPYRGHYGYAAATMRGTSGVGRASGRGRQAWTSAGTATSSGELASQVSIAVGRTITTMCLRYTGVAEVVLCWAMKQVPSTMGSAMELRLYLATSILSSLSLSREHIPLSIVRLVIEGYNRISSPIGPSPTHIVHASSVTRTVQERWIECASAALRSDLVRYLRGQFGIASSSGSTSSSSPLSSPMLSPLTWSGGSSKYTTSSPTSPVRSPITIPKHGSDDGKGQKRGTGSPLSASAPAYVPSMYASGGTTIPHNTSMPTMVESDAESSPEQTRSPPRSRNPATRGPHGTFIDAIVRGDMMTFTALLPLNIPHASEDNLREAVVAFTSHSRLDMLRQYVLHPTWGRITSVTIHLAGPDQLDLARNAMRTMITSIGLKMALAWGDRRVVDYITSVQHDMAPRHFVEHSRQLAGQVLAYAAVMEAVASQLGEETPPIPNWLIKCQRALSRQKCSWIGV